MSEGRRRRAPFECLAAAVAYALALAVFKALPRYDCIALPIALFWIFRRLDRASTRGRSAGLFGVTVALLSAYLLHLWTLGYEGRNAVFGGILPWSDSHDYYGDALRFVFGDRFWEVGSKRPLYPVTLAALLRLTGGDLRLALAITAIVSAWAVSKAALEVWRTHGPRSALVVYLLLFFVERRWTGFVQTEHLGLPLGAVAFALVWRAAGSSPARARRLVLSALFALTLALLARTGAFFVLPALALFALLRFVPSGRWRRARFAAAAGAIVLFGFALNRAVIAVSGSGVMFSDYPGIVYGMMHDEGFDYIKEVHPDLRTMPLERRVAESWAIVREDAKAHPSAIVAGLAKAGLGLFFSPSGMFGYVWTNPDDHVLDNGAVVRASLDEHGWLGPVLLWKRELGLYSLLNAGAMGLLGGALVLGTMWSAFVVFVRRRRDPDLSLLRWSFAGIAGSAPFLPPSITSGQQTQTATMAFVAALSAVVLFGRPRRSPSGLGDARGRDGGPLWLLPPAASAAILATVAWMRAAPAFAPTCHPGEHVVRIFPRTDVTVARERSLDPRRNAESDLRRSLPLLRRHNPELVGSLEPFLHPGTRYVSGFDACDRAVKILVDDGAVLGSSRAFRPIMATPLATPELVHVERADVPVLP